MDQQILSLLKPLFQSSSNLNYNYVASELSKIAQCLIQLSVNIENLAKQLTKNENNVAPPFPPKLNNYTNVGINNVNAFSNKQEDNSKKYGSKNTALIERLALLKNNRNDSFYKMKRNKILYEMIENNLSCNPKRIPKQFVPKMTRNEPEEIKNHKIKVALQETENEINKLKLHYSIHLNKIERLEKEIFQLIANEVPPEKQSNYIENYKTITFKSDEKTIKKLTLKQSFFNSNQYMSNLDFMKNTSSNTPTENKDLDQNHQPTTLECNSQFLSQHLSDFAFTELPSQDLEPFENTQLKRKAPNTSTNSLDESLIKKKPGNVNSTSQPSFMTPTISSNSKNGMATRPKANRALSLTQQ